MPQRQSQIDRAVDAALDLFALVQTICPGVPIVIEPDDQGRLLNMVQLVVSETEDAHKWQRAGISMMKTGEIAGQIRRDFGPLPPDDVLLAEVPARKR